MANNIIDHYPESLRDLYDKLIESLEELGESGETLEVAFNVTEWIRKHWNRRVITPGWWGVIRAEEEPGELLPNVEVVADPIRTLRGRELRLAIWEIMALRGLPRSCRVASTLAAKVEAEWSRHPIYVPIARSVDRAVRDAAIWRDFNGFGTISHVIEKHNLSQSVIYDVYRKLQKEKESREQPALPGVG
jgi:hypothetical protein